MGSIPFIAIERQSMPPTALEDFARNVIYP
jgi:hypothetical protein